MVLRRKVKKIMAILEIISAFSASGLLGGITGLIGNELKSRRDLKMLKLNNELEQAAWPERAKVREHEIAMRRGAFDHELKLHDLNARAKYEENEQALIMQEGKISGQGLISAIQNDTMQNDVPIWAKTIRTLTRPFLTVISLIFLAAIYFTSLPEQRLAIISAVIYMTVAGYLFWFGDRPSAAMKKMLLGASGPL